MFNCVGKTSNNEQFLTFVTGAYPINPETGEPTFPDPSDPEWQVKKRWYGVVHVFDMEGNHLKYLAMSGGTQADGKNESCQRAFAMTNDAVLSLGELEFCDIYVKEFSVEKEGYLFALVYNKTEDGEHVILWPNDIMFHPPWDGEYST